MTSIKKRGNRTKERVVLVIGILVFLAILVFIDPSYTALTTRESSNSSLLYLVDLIVIIVGFSLLYRFVINR